MLASPPILLLTPDSNSLAPVATSSSNQTILVNEASFSASKNHCSPTNSSTYAPFPILTAFNNQISMLQSLASFVSSRQILTHTLTSFKHLQLFTDIASG